VPPHFKGKIIILGIDGLEYNLVNEWNLEYLKQKAYCKTDLSDFKMIVTPLIWGAILTGQKIKEIEDMCLRRLKYVSKHSKSSKPVWYSRLMTKILPKKLKQYIFKKHIPNPYDVVLKRGYTTLFSFFKRSWHNGIPSYGKKVANSESRKLTEQALKGDTSPLYNYSKRIYEEEKKKLLIALKKNYNLIFWYTSSLDTIEHFFITKKLKLMNFYLELNLLVKNIKEKLTENDIIYIISDHGMKQMGDDIRAGEHSNYGFFSSSTGELIQKPHDLFNIIKNK